MKYKKEKAPPSKHCFDGSMSEMSSEHRASPVGFYTVITGQTTAHFFPLSPLTTPHNGQEGNTDTDCWKTTYSAFQCWGSCLQEALL